MLIKNYFYYLLIYHLSSYFFLIKKNVYQFNTHIYNLIHIYTISYSQLLIDFNFKNVIFSSSNFTSPYFALPSIFKPNGSTFGL
jgi:hypothetical protein